jgi:hypothetical protein
MTKQKIVLTNMDLFHNRYKYNIDLLEQNIDHLNNKYLLYTQKLTAEFCVKYLYNPDINSGDEDSYIFDKYYILAQQKHISEKEFDDTLNKYTQS